MTIRRLPLFALAAVLLSGCATTSIASDLGRVRELSRAPALAPVARGHVGAETNPDVAKLLRQPLDPERAVRVALLNNRELRARLRELGIARGRLVQAGRIANPVIELETLPERDTSYEIRVEYEITSLIMAPMRARAAEADLEAERHRVASDVVQLGFEVRTAFYELLAAEQRLELARRALDAFGASRDAAEALLTAGNIPPVQAATEIAAHERARVTTAELELAAIERRERVQRLLGLYGTEAPWRAASQLPDVPEALHPGVRAEAEAIERSHDLAAVGRQAEAVARQARVSRTEGWLPDVTIDLHSLHGSPEPVPGANDDSSWRFGGGISLGLPLFDRQQGTTRALEAELGALRERYQALVIEIRSAVRTTQSRLASAHTRALQYRTLILPAQQAVMGQTLLQYNAMQVGVFDLIAARRDQLQVELAYVDTLEDYWSASAALDALLHGTRIGSGPRTARTLDDSHGAQ